MTPLLSELHVVHADPYAAARASGRPVVGLIGAAIPVELVRAAGCFPVALRARAEDHGRDSSPMEAGHEAEARSLFVQAIDGDFAACDLIVIASTSDGYRYLYQYLKQMVRTGRGDALPPIVLYDFLFGDSPSVRSYDGEILRQFATRLGMLGTPATDTAIAEAVDAANRVRSRLSQLAELRTAGRLSCSTALLAIAASALLDPTAADALLARAIAHAGPPSTAPRLLVASSVPLYDTGLYEMLEAAGGHVVAEDDEWGPRRGGPAIGAGDAALLDHYLLHTASPRQPTAVREAWFAEQLTSAIDAVVFYMPPEDQVFGWRYPALAQKCRDASIPFLLLREDVTLDRAAATAAATQFLASLGVQP